MQINWISCIIMAMILLSLGFSGCVEKKYVNSNETTEVSLEDLPSGKNLSNQKDSASRVKEELGPYTISFGAKLIDDVKVLPMKRGEKYQSYMLELHNDQAENLGNIQINNYAGHIKKNGWDNTRKKQIEDFIKDQGCTNVTSNEIEIDSRKGILVACESDDFFVFEYLIARDANVFGLILLPWNDNIKDLIDTLHIVKNG